MERENKRKTIGVVTGTRAEFGLLTPVLDAVLASNYSLRLYVTGTHLADAFGRTENEVTARGYDIYERIDILRNDPETSVQTAMSRAFSEFSISFFTNKPDILVVLGDRYESFAAAMAAAMAEVPVAHISGGDVTEGAKDDFFRHCMTKLAYLHFPSTETYRKRVVQLGEAPDRVFNVGALGAENIAKIPALSKKELTDDVGFDFNKDYLLVTYHPETAEGGDPVAGLDELLRAIDDAKLSALFTKANADAGGNAINERLEKYCEEKSDCMLVDSLGMTRYLSAMRYARAVVGNSSSAIVETPSLKIPAVNIGDRQKGRVMGENVVNCAADASAIEAAIKTAITDDFRAEIKDMKNPYGGEDVGRKIIAHIADFFESGESGLKKSFYDIDFKLPEEVE